MKKFAVTALLLMTTVAAFGQQPTTTTPNADLKAKDGVYYISKVGKKVGRVSLALFGSAVDGVKHLVVKDAPSVGKTAVKTGVHVGKDAVSTGKAVVTDVRK